MAQAVEYLLCKHKILSSNPSPTKRIKEGEREERDRQTDRQSWGGVGSKL
jgi:hypothetical protein